MYIDLLITIGIVAVICIFIGIYKEPKPKYAKRKPIYQDTRETEAPQVDEQEQLYLAQMDAIQQATFTPQKLLNHSEKKIYWELVKLVRGKYIVTIQPSMGAMLNASTNQAFRAICSKRPDIALLNKQTFQPVMVIEYHGKGHYQQGGHAKIRDTIKQQALEKAGITYVVLRTVQQEALVELLRKHNL